ncbi:chondroitin sulfate proteoglycan 4-like [Osmerus eperlanus]|uniref:chondroitin sulfate proteoglycan 4-like n=1 Tax=Osmerus eperlanus TaxID=29151 RepID=UPI002E14C8BF
MGTFSLINELFLTKLLILLLSSRQVLGASFYGDSYVHLKTSEVSSKTSLHVRFKTSCPSGILFLSVGEKDFLFLELHSGRLQMRLDLGSGERSLRSEKGVHLNDLIWHSVELQHDLHNVTMTVDHHSHTNLRMPGPDLDLGVQGGLYVGGLAGMDRAFVPGGHPGYNSTGFRGCVDEVVFNQHNLLSSLRSYSGYKSVHEVSLGCSPQFSATNDDPISFFSSRAFLSLPPWDVAQEGEFECEIHTPAGAGDGLVLYSSAQHGGFVALEVWEGALVLLVGTGGNKTELRSLTHVNDEAWHPVSLRLLSHSLQLRVGEEEVNTSLVPPHPKALQFSGPLYLGGVSDQKRPEVRSAGLLLVDGRWLRGGGSFKGCLRNIRVNSQVTGLPHATITKDVFVGCEPEKIPEPLTTPIPTDHLASVSPTSGHHSGGDRRKNYPSFLLLKDLVVAEGGIAVLEAKHIKVNLDLRKLGLRQSQVRFRVEEQPVHGQLKLDLSSGSDWEEEEGGVFGMLDLWNGRVMYIHGGSEDAQDFFMFSVFTTSKKQLPSYLKGNRLHRFNITVTPINDAPELSLPEGHLFALLEHSRRPLTTDVLWVSDPDTNSTQLNFIMLGSSDAGHLEHQDVPGTSITSFSLPDLEDGKISYVHTGTNTSRLALRVSDGEKVSNTVVLRLLAVPLEHHVVNNTGVEVGQGRAAVLSSTHLAVQVNVDFARQPVEVRFDVLEGPHYGELQRLHSNGEWKPTSYFYQKLLEKERIRYLNTFHGLQTGNVSDQFRCKVTINAIVKDEVVFPITVHWIHYRVTHSKMEVSAVRKVVITPQDLCVVSKGVKLSESELFFRLISLPKKGNLVLNHKVLKKNSTFSQKNVSDHQVRYELGSRLHKDMKDGFTFQVFSRHGPHTGSQEFRITIRADHSHSMELLNLGLSVMEGDSKVITRDRLFIQTASSKTVLYTITRGPKHGRVRRINLSNSSSINDNIGSFTNQDIAEERIMYVHDDSETKEDSFMFVAAMSKSKHSAKKEDTNTLQDTFNISVQLVNDQKPVRIIDNVFHVVREGQKLLTVDDLYFHDPDSDFDDGQLVYTRRGIPLGDLVLVNDTSHRLYQFTQADLDERRVLFLHRGVSSGRFVLFVSDGKHYVSCLLEVLAQDPYVHVQNNTGVHVQQGHAATLFPTNLSVVTNMDVRDEQEVMYNIFLPPKHGSLVFNNSQGAVKAEQFTQGDLRAGRLVYRHDNSHVLVDGFNMTVAVGEVLVDVGVGVKVFLESHQRPPTVRHHEQLVVEEGRIVEISQEQLEVVHEDSPSSEILFTVKMAPAHGFLRRSANGGHEEDSYQGTEAKPLHTFLQEDVNLGLLQYVQTHPAHTNDSFLLDATNGVTELTDIKVNVDIIPYFVPLQVANMTLDEGSSHALTSAIIKVTNKHFTGLNYMYHVTEPPHHGHIEHLHLHGVPIHYFSHREVEQEDIYYIHDGSDTLRDNFTLVANSSELGKHSLPCTVFVNITPVNNQPPIVTTNRILRVWVGSVTEISVDDLSAEDRDSEPESLEFIVTPPSNGHLALKNAPFRHILNFTQAHILRGQLMFVHSGASSGGFHFQVNDGVNFAPREIFSTVARTLVLTMLRNQALQVFPGSVTTISQKDLLVVTNANGEMRGNHSVVFRVTSPPKLGRLLRTMDNTTLVVNTFTQSMINKGVLSYHQTHPESVGWTSSDSFTFSVSSPPALLHPTIFHIHISYDHSTPQQSTVLLANTGTMVPEGGKVIIDRSKLDASNLLGELPESQRSDHQVWYHLTSLPQHGVIAAGGQNLTGDKSGFSQLMLDQSGITYVHDDSESAWDYFSFEVWICPEGQMQPQPPLGERRVVAERFHITVTSVNDHTPLLKNGPNGLSVAKGEIVKIRSVHLQVDQDCPPEEIIYSVISQPSSGYLSLGHRDSLGPPVASFSQANVNQGMLHFVQQGELSTGVFYFNITDGKHRPLYKLFNLEVVTVTLLNNTGLGLLQGQTSVVLSTDQLAAQTNTRSNASIVYTVTTAPRHGNLRKSHKEVVVFSQEDIRTGQVAYHMTDFAASNDSFEITVTAMTSDFNLTLVNQEVMVMVRPLIYLREPVLVPSGIIYKLRKDTLDATELATVSGSNPHFRILSAPKHAKLVKLPFDLRGVGSHPPATEFTFRDVEHGRVAIEEFLSNSTLIHHHHGNKTAMGVTALKDSFVFLLTAERVQPAVGELRFTIVSYHQTLPPNVHNTRHPGHKRVTVHSHTFLPTHPHTPAQKNHTTLHRWGNHTHHKHRHRWGNQTTHATTSTVPQGPTVMHWVTPQLKTPPIRVESLPRPASDPLLIILPFLACLLLIVILVVLILVFRHRREKRALSGLIQELAVPISAQDGSPYLGRPERSVAVPSVVVTPLVPSCPNSPVFPWVYSGCLVPGVTVWGPVVPRSPLQSRRSPTPTSNPTLRYNQYWV